MYIVQFSRPGVSHLCLYVTLLAFMGYRMGQIKRGHSPDWTFDCNSG